MPKFVTVAWIFSSGGAEMQNSDCLFFCAMKTNIFWLARFAGNEGTNQNQSQSIPTQSTEKKHLSQTKFWIIPYSSSARLFLCIRKAHWILLSKKDGQKSCRLKFGVFFFVRVWKVTKSGGSTSNDKVSSLQVPSLKQKGWGADFPRVKNARLFGRNRGDFGVVTFWPFFWWMFHIMLISWYPYEIILDRGLYCWNPWSYTEKHQETPASLDFLTWTNREVKRLGVHKPVSSTWGAATSRNKEGKL